MTQNSTIPRIAIIDGTRTPFCRIGTTLRSASAIDLGVSVVNALEKKYTLRALDRGLVTFGSVILHSDVSNFAREIVLESTLNPNTPAFSNILACATSLSTFIEAASWLKQGAADWAIAGGAESMSNFPVVYSKSFAHLMGDLKFEKKTPSKLKRLLQFSFKDVLPQFIPVAERITGLSMGEHCEMMVDEWKVERSLQDKIALKSHQNASKNTKWHSEFLCPVKGVGINIKDNLVRADSSFEKLAKLPPSFKKTGTLTAGNSSPLTDGGAGVLLATEEYAKKKGWPILAFLDDFELAAIDLKTEGLLMAPSYAILRLLNRKQKKLSSFDLVEIHEAFAAQVLCNLKAVATPDWAKNKVHLNAIDELDPLAEKVNPYGGSLALGHPFAATGARMLMQAATHLGQNEQKSALLSVCAAGGLGLIATLTRD